MALILHRDLRHNQHHTLSWLFLIIAALIHQSHAEGTLAFFHDYGCKRPTTLLPSTTLALSTCLVPNGAVAVSVQQLPACPDGRAATIILYSDTSCARDMSEGSGGPGPSGWESVDNCFYVYVSDSIPGLMFTCENPDAKPMATATQTIDVTKLAPVATTGPPASTGTGDGTGGGSGGSTDTGDGTGGETGGGGITTDDGADNTSADEGGSSTTSGDSNNSGGGGSSGSDAAGSTGSGLSQSDKIAIGVGLGVGVPTILIALAAWCCPGFWSNLLS